MRREGSCVLVLLLLVSCIFTAGPVGVAATGLVRNYYKKNTTCEDAEEFIRHQVTEFWKKDRSITPKLLRLLYTDCFVTGCDASILLDSKPNSERTASQNRGLGGFAFLDKVKTVLEQKCPQVVSCADLLTLATRDALHLAGAPSYPVLTGRMDGFVSTAASVDLPSPSISWEASLAYFQSKGLNLLDMVTLLGGHSLGSTHCSYILDRLYNYKGSKKPDPSMNLTLLAELQKKCPPRTKKVQTDPYVFLNQESGTKYNFTSSYYSRVIQNKGVLGVDQILLSTDDSTEVTQLFAGGFEDFRRSWAVSVNKMARIGVITEKGKGEIRRNCHYTNRDNPST
ncbi:peroxidase [Ranunculus cassubicifolius]